MNWQEVLLMIAKIYAVILGIEIVIIALRYFRADDSRNSPEAIMEELMHEDSNDEQ